MDKNWFAGHLIEIFGAATGILYVLLEIRRVILLWPLGIITSAVYIYVFGKSGFYAGMTLQGYYVIISIYGWYVWQKAGSRHGVTGEAGPEVADDIRRITPVISWLSLAAALILWVVLWFLLGRFTDSPVPLWDGLITSLSVVATWMLAKKILEQWYVWIVANIIAFIVYLAMGMIPTAILFAVYTAMAVVGLRTWKRANGETIKTKVV